MSTSGFPVLPRQHLDHAPPCSALTQWKDEGKGKKRRREEEVRGRRAEDEGAKAGTCLSERTLVHGVRTQSCTNAARASAGR
eukprot:746860-Hanusia_phi.AAC.2